MDSSASPAGREAPRARRLPLALAAELARELPGRSLAAFWLTAAVGLTQGLGAALLVPILAALGLSASEGRVGQLATGVTEAFLSLGLAPGLAPLLTLFVAVGVADALLGRWQTTAQLRLQHELAAHLRVRLYRALVRANWLFHLHHRASTLSHALTTEVNRVGMATYHLLSLVASVLVGAVYLVLAVRVSAALTGLVLAAGGSLLVLIRDRDRAARLSGEQLSLATTGLYAAAIEHLAEMKTVKGYGAEERSAEEFERLAGEVAGVHVGAIAGHAGAKALFTGGSVAILAASLYAGAVWLSLPPATLLFLVFLFARLMPRIGSAQQSYQHLLNLLPALGEVRALEAAARQARESMGEAMAAPVLRGAIRLDRVSVGYGGAEDRLVLRDVDLSIAAGRTTALVGPSGAGKSTVADLVLGLVAPARGRVLVDGQPLGQEQAAAWRRTVGYVGQDTHLFPGSVVQNLRWARPGAPEEEMWEALRLAAAAEFVARLPAGLETALGDRGLCLSGGERQRLALARALLRRPALLVLDEPTSELDAENEAQIAETIAGLRGSLTILLITHGSPAAFGADHVYALLEGRVAAVSEVAPVRG